MQRQKNSTHSSPQNQTSNNLGRPDGFVPVYNSDYSQNNPDLAPTKIPANPLISLAIVGGLILIVMGLGSTMLRGFQTDQDVQGKIDIAVKEALSKQQTSVADCINTVFDGKAKTIKKHRNFAQ